MKKKISIMLLTILAFSLVIVGCGNNTPTAVVKSYFEDIKKGKDSEVVKKALEEAEGNNDLPEEAKDAVCDMLTKLEVTVVEEKIDGDTATVNVKVKGVALSTVMNNYMQKIISENSRLKDLSDEDAEKEAENMLVEVINDTETEEREGVVNLTKEDDKWQIEDDDDLVNVLYGEFN